MKTEAALLASVTLERDQWREACLAHGEKAAAAERERDQLRAKLAEYENALVAFEAKTNNVPLGQENREKGSSVYNWRKSCLDEIRAAIRSRTGGENE